MVILEGGQTSLLGDWPVAHKLKQLSGASEIDIAKTCWNTLPDVSNLLCFISASQGSNCFGNLYKEGSSGRIELMFVSSGTTEIWKRGYGDSDFIKL